MLANKQNGRSSLDQHENTSVPSQCNPHNSSYHSKLSKSLVTGKEHLKFQREDKLSQCDDCHKFFSTAGNLQKHKMIHSGEKPFKCEMCDKCFNQAGSLRRHLLIHTGEKPFQCNDCDKCFRYTEDLKKHKSKTHKGQLPLRNNNQDKSCNEKKSVRQGNGLYTHKGKNLFRCDDCNKCFSISGNLQKHKMIHTGEKPFKCEMCDKCFNQAGSLKRHLLIHTREKPFQCSDCNKCFRNADYLKKHKVTHTRLGPVTFNKTGVSLCQKRALKQHNGVPFQCNLCRKCFSVLENLTKHRRAHTVEKHFKCEHCQKFYSTAENLKKHQMLHTGEKPFICSKCDKCFNQAISLKRHQLIHAGVKPFKCNYCDKSFRHAPTLQLHKRTRKHQKELLRQYTLKCDQQQKQFVPEGKKLEKESAPNANGTEEASFGSSQCGDCFTQKQDENGTDNEVFSISELLGRFRGDS